MRKSVTRRTIVAATAALAAALLQAGGAAAAAPPSCAVTFNAPGGAAGGTAFDVSVNVTRVSSFDAGQFDVCFDESLLQLEDVTAGEIGAIVIPVDLWSRVGPGAYRIIVNVPGVPGVSGSGSLAVLHFVAAGAAGTAVLTPENGFLNTSSGEEIAATWAPDSVNLLCAPGGPAPSPDGGPSASAPPAPGRSPVWPWGLAAAGAVIITAGAAVVFARHSLARK